MGRRDGAGNRCANNRRSAEAAVRRLVFLPRNVWSRAWAMGGHARVQPCAFFSLKALRLFVYFGASSQCNYSRQRASRELRCEIGAGVPQRSSCSRARLARQSPLNSFAFARSTRCMAASHTPTISSASKPGSASRFWRKKLRLCLCSLFGDEIRCHADACDVSQIAVQHHPE